MEKQETKSSLISNKEESSKVNFFSLFKYSDWKDLLLIFLGLTGAIVHGVVPSFFSLLFGDVINAFSGNSISAQEGVLVVVYNFLILAAVSVTSAYLQITCLMISGQRQSNRIRNLYFRSVVSQEMEWHDKKKSGDLVNLIGGDMVQIQEAISEKLGSFFQFSSTFISGFVIGFIEGWQLSLVTFAMVPLIALTGGISSYMLSRFSSQGSDASGKVGSVAQQAIGNIKTVASLSGEETEKKNYYNATYQDLLAGIKKSHSAGFGYGSILLFSTASFSLTFWYGFQLVSKGVMGPGDVITVLLGIFIGATSLGQASPSLTAFAVGVSSAKKIFDIIDKKSNIDSFSKSGIVPDTIKGHIVFDNVHFRYPSRPEQKILNGMSFTVSPGQTIAFVGHSGCGKSTSIGLLQRFYDFEQGKITIDGHDIKDLSISWLREQIGVVSQEPVLFARSIADNISCGKVDASKEKIIQAAKDANIHDFIVSLPEGYNTVLGERGTQLSGGQKQRIAIARAIYKNPTILLLDEATSALDNKSERIVQDALEKASQGRTTIVIAHRLSTIQNSDIIYVVESGQVSEQGTHEELMSKETRSLYQELVKAQQKPRVEEEKNEEQDENEQEQQQEQQQQNVLKNEKTLSLPNKSEKVSSSRRYEDFDMEMQDDSKILKRSNRALWLKLFRLNAPEIYYLLVGNFGAAVTGVANPLFSVIFSRIVAQMAQGEDGGYSIVFWCLMFLVLAIGSGLSGYLQSSMLGISGEKLTFRIRNQMFESIIKQEVAWFDKQENSSGILTNRLSADATLVKSVTGEKVGWFVQVLASLISSLIIAIIPCWEVALLVLSCVPLITIGSVLELQLIIGFNRKAKKFYEESGRTASEAITNIKTVASLGLESDFMKIYERSVEKADNQTTKTSFIAGAGYSFGTSVQNLIWPAAFYFGAWLVDNQRCTFGGMMEAISSIFFTALYFGEAFITVSSIGKSLQAARNIFQIIERKSLIDPTSEEGTRIKDIKGEIEFKNVHFSYPTRPGVPVLKGFNLKIKPGETVALVGASGCGKSTCVGLLERFYTPSKGKILVDGQDISTMNLKSLRGKIGLVSQEPVLFDMSIKENILYSIPESVAVEDEKIERVCKEANVYDFLQNLPDHLNTQVGERGSKLSGGQKQRVAIARALIRDPSILLLDEATSALDTESEKVVQEALDRARKGRTTLVIAHRLSTIRSADQIVVVEEGKVVEKGTHEELMAAKSTYYTLVNSSLHSHN